MHQIVFIPVAEIYPHPENPRKDLGDLTELAESIKTKGILQNLTVVKGHVIDDEQWLKLAARYRKESPEKLQDKLDEHESAGGYTVVIGHRRLAAAKLAGLRSVPCAIARMSHQEQVETMLLENMQRTDLTLLEQAQGFQMLLDFGDSVEIVAEKTGFSASTIRRRLKMMELDQKKLMKVMAERQTTLEDFDRLSRIEDVKERNSVLKYIGTKEFDIKVGLALRKQANAKNLVKAEAWLAETGAEERDTGDRWKAEYRWINDCTVDLGMDWDTESWKLEAAKVAAGGKLYYAFSGSKELLYFLADNPNGVAGAPKEETPEELEQKRKAEAAWEYLESQWALMQGLRNNFMQKLRVTEKNKKDVMMGAVHFLMSNRSYIYVEMKEVLKEALGSENCQVEEDGKLTEWLELVNRLSGKELCMVLYRLFNDRPKNLPLPVTNNWQRETSLPEYKENDKLTALYYWMCMLGYQMSDIEHAITFGTASCYKGRAAEEGEQS